VTAATDADLLRLIARGDQAAFDEFYGRTSPWLAVRLGRRCRDPDLVAEVVQDTYLTVWRAARGFVETGAGEGALGWLWTIAARRLVDALRRREREARQVPMAGREALAPAAEEEALRASLDETMVDALRRLAPDLRQVMQAMVLDGLSVRETSILLGIPEGTVKTRARRARIALREALS
jgi:RNA polymerase sigma-70 factor (ECF subfamily)